jgi:hypothetical protein
MKYQREEILQPSWQVLHLIRQVALCLSVNKIKMWNNFFKLKEIKQYGNTHFSLTLISQFPKFAKGY